MGAIYLAAATVKNTGQIMVIKIANTGKSEPITVMLLSKDFTNMAKAAEHKAKHTVAAV